MGRLIDADKLMEDVRENSESYFADDFAKQWVDRQQTIEAIPLAWIKGYIVTCDLFDLRVIVPASKVIKTMVKIWKQENPGAKKGGTDAVNN